MSIPDQRTTSAPERLIGRVAGVCGPPGHSLRAPGEPRLGSRVVRDAPTRPLGATPAYSGRGFGADQREALIGAIGETFERYSLLDLDDRRTSRASVAELTRRSVRHLPPARLLGLTTGDGEPSRLGAFDPLPAAERPIQWVSAVDLVSGAETLLPARYCIMFGDEPASRAGDEGHWYCATSNGAATAASPSQACLAGLFELLERDAFMLMWYHRLRFPYLTVPTASQVGRRLAGALAGCRLEHRLIDLTGVHGVPAVVAVLRGEVAGDRQYGIGAGSARTVAVAAWRAAKEALAFYAWQRRQQVRGAYRPLRADQVRSFGDHPMYYMDNQHQAELEFLFEDRPGRADLAGAPEWLDGPPAGVLRRLAARLRDRQIELYAIDLTPDGAPVVGMFTYRVVSPQLLPLDCDHRARHLSHARLLAEPTRQGWRPDRPTVADLNHAPHPFP